MPNINPPPISPPSVKPRHKRLSTSLVLVILITLVLGGYLLLKAAGALLIIADPLKKADAVVALSGDNGDRITEAARLIAEDYANKLFITFTDEDTVKNLMSSAVLQGIPYKKIFVTEIEVTSTVEEAEGIRDLALERGTSSIIVITDPFHTLRTRLIFRTVLEDSGIAVQVRPVRNHWYKSGTWWSTREGIQYTMQEYIKIYLFLFGVS